MKELVIREHDFDDAKEELRRFSRQTITNLDLGKVDDKKGLVETLCDGGLLRDHKVTGKELNELTKKVQGHLQRINNTQNQLIGEFGQVYCALEALDKYYIQAILIAVNDNKRTGEKLKEAQDDIKKLIESQKGTLRVLLKFKQQLDNNSHLKDIDIIWDDCQKWHDEISALTTTIGKTVSIGSENARLLETVQMAQEQTDTKVATLYDCLNEQILRLDTVITALSRLDEITHLEDIDEMWTSLADAHNQITNCRDELSKTQGIVVKQQSDIERMLAFVESLSQFKHLHDIDCIWAKTESHEAKIVELADQGTRTLEEVHENHLAIADLTAYKEMLSGISHLSDVDSIWEDSNVQANQIAVLQKQEEVTQNLIQSNKELAAQSLADANELTKSAIQMLNRKIQYAYWIAGGSFALALVELLVVLLR